MAESFIMGGKSKGLESLLENTNLGYKVPGYDRIDVSHYDLIEKQLYIANIASAINTLKDPNRTVTPFAALKLPKEIENQIDILAKKYKGKDVIVRSDSLREDSEHSFAGIYNSFVIEKVTKEKLTDAVIKVYASLNSEKAQRYRVEHSITDDKMGVIIQEFVDPDISGVMYTSNPSFPLDLVLEFYFGRVNKNSDDRPYIFDYDKKSGQKVFESENYRDIERRFERKEEEEFNELMKKLMKVGVNLEKKLGPSDIEFLLKNKEIYLVQRREITDLEEPVEVTIPKYDKKQFIGSTKVIRGKGKFTLPVVSVLDMHELDKGTDLLAIIEPEKWVELVRKYFDGVVKLNEQYKDGYVLLVPHFDATVIKRWGQQFGAYSSELPSEPTMDNLTPNKKAVITTAGALISSHIMTVAREKGIVYAGFDEEGKFKDIDTGDVLSLYFKGREAFVYKEKTPLKSIKETHPKVSIKIKKRRDGGLAFETPDYNYLGSHKTILNDFEYFLNQTTNDEWKRTTIGDDMGATFTNSKGRSIYVGIGAQHGSYYWWSLMCESCIIGFKKPFPKNEFNDILQKYVKHLKK